MSTPDRLSSARALEALWPEFRGRLNPRQVQVLGLVIDGLSQREIAEALGISIKTVEGRLHDIRVALGYPDRRSLAASLLKSLVGRLAYERQGPPVA